MAALSLFIKKRKREIYGLADRKDSLCSFICFDLFNLFLSVLICLNLFYLFVSAFICFFFNLVFDLFFKNLFSPVAFCFYALEVMLFTYLLTY